MTCVTPSNPDSIPFGESLEISDSLARTSGGSLFADGRSMATHEAQLPLLPPPTDLSDAEVMGEQHRVHETHFLVAQTASKASEITRLWRELQEQTRLSKMGFSRDAASIAAAAQTRNRRKAATTVDAEEPKRKVSVRFEDDPELLPRPVSAPAASTRSRATKTTPSRPRRSSKAAASKDDDGFFDDDEALPDEAEDQFSAFHPVSRAQV